MKSNSVKIEEPLQLDYSGIFFFGMHFPELLVLGPSRHVGGSTFQLSGVYLCPFSMKFPCKIKYKRFIYLFINLPQENLKFLFFLLPSSSIIIIFIIFSSFPFVSKNQREVERNFENSKTAEISRKKEVFGNIT